MYLIIFFKNHTGLAIKKATPAGGFFLVNQQLFRKIDDLHVEMFLPGIELFSQRATPKISSPLMRFTTEFEMDRSGSTSP
ncbi:hypothetical protein PMIT1342_00032 [Prochlorococcus marinus str. MIT 1342]|nr:hypothetical protein PMIT1342_00032 [Prochlorococcus marinus str. MIT 1342]